MKVCFDTYNTYNKDYIIDDDDLQYEQYQRLHKINKFFSDSKDLNLISDQFEKLLRRELKSFLAKLENLKSNAIVFDSLKSK